jgi:phospholipid/cholesterol/gamma-HCH transport system permease protein
LLKQASSRAPQAEPWFNADKTDEGLILRFGGPWVCLNLGALEPELDSFLQGDFPQKLTIKAIVEKECVLDTAGACLLARVINSFRTSQRPVEVICTSPSPLLDYFLKTKPPAQSSVSRLNWKTRWLDNIGRSTVIFGKTALNLLGFFGEILVTGLKTIKSTARFRWVSIIHHIEEVGLKALPIIGLISFLIGMVLAYQSINQLRKFGAELYTIDFLGVSILREIAVLLTAIVIAGRSGSAFTAQVGTMALNQEIDAIRMLGLNPILVLVIPRLLAMLICLPILVFFAMIMGLVGGMIMVGLIIDITPLQYIRHLQHVVTPSAFWVGMSKAPLFAILISLVGCFRGLQVKGSAESVGRMTTQSVVESIFLVIVCDALMSILFSYLKI